MSIWEDMANARAESHFRCTWHTRSVAVSRHRRIYETANAVSALHYLLMGDEA